ncbi:hypothetical protein J2T02_002649 [Chitinophaga terrae (ex Kim and Jung 2007)]|uniref:hypothetical protein n=1 Tax=Chitinophaga terrae (ex Kim and Jung 2007) TaxID=408074 RepID=UPI0027854BA3|nr:hypothetical protein [Chitinophaga terrae (ex Kim and Jung 2007)]MDQ0107530.1 hypothetical protein [Chitinophaga terrae (ex Kim and Jung 2007)]
MKLLFVTFIPISIILLSCTKSTNKSKVKYHIAEKNITIKVVDNENKGTRTFILPDGKKIQTKIPEIKDTSSKDLSYSGVHIKSELFEDPENLLQQVIDSNSSGPTLPR